MENPTRVSSLSSAQGRARARALAPALALALAMPMATLAACARDPSAPPIAPRLLVGAPPSARALFEAAVRAHAAREQSPEPPSLLVASAEELAKSGLPLDVVAVDELAGLGLLPPLVAERAWARDPVLVVARKAALEGVTSSPSPSPSPSSSASLARLPELPSVRRIAIPDSRGADGAGAAAEAVLGAVGVRHKLGARLQYVGTPAQARAEITAGRVDVVLLRASDLAGLDLAAAGLVVLERLDPPRARHTAGVVSVSPRKDEARRFLDLLTSEELAAHVTALGLERPLPPVSR